MQKTEEIVRVVLKFPVFLICTLNEIRFVVSFYSSSHTHPQNILLFIKIWFFSLQVKYTPLSFWIQECPCDLLWQGNASRSNVLLGGFSDCKTCINMMFMGQIVKWLMKSMLFGQRGTWEVNLATVRQWNFLALFHCSITYSISTDTTNKFPYALWFTKQSFMTLSLSYNIGGQGNNKPEDQRAKTERSNWNKLVQWFPDLK